MYTNSKTTQIYKSDQQKSVYDKGKTLFYLYLILEYIYRVSQIKVHQVMLRYEVFPQINFKTFISRQYMKTLREFFRIYYNLSKNDHLHLKFRQQQMYLRHQILKTRNLHLSFLKFLRTKKGQISIFQKSSKISCLRALSFHTYD